MINLHKYGKDHPINFQLANYVDNGNLYIGMLTNEDGYPEQWQNLTVNLSVKCADDCAYIDINNNGNDIIGWLESNGLGHCTGNMMPSGWCVYPEFRFNMEALMQHVLSDARKLI